MTANRPARFESDCRLAVCGRFDLVHIVQRNSGEPTVLNYGYPLCRAWELCCSIVPEDARRHQYSLEHCPLRDHPNAIAVGGGAGIISFIEADDEKTLLAPAASVLRGHSGWVVDMVALPDSFGGKPVLSSCANGDCEIRLWPDLNAAAEGRKRPPCLLLSGHRDVVVGLCSVGSKRIASVSNDQRVRFWDIEQQKTVPDGVVRCARSSESLHTVESMVGRDCVLCGGSKIRMVSLDSFQRVGTFRGSALSLVTHPTRENVFFSGTNEGAVKQWDLRKKTECVKELEGRPHLFEAIIQMIYVGQNQFASCGASHYRDAGCHAAVEFWTDEMKTLSDSVLTKSHNFGLACLGALDEQLLLQRYEQAELQARAAFVLDRLQGERGGLFVVVVKDSPTQLRLRLPLWSQ